jgi:hypothetical protein
MVVERVRSDVGLLWVGLLAGPIAWAVQLLVVFSMAAWVCDGGPAWLTHLVSLLCLLAATGGAYLAWRDWRTVGGWPESEDAVDLGRTRLMAVLGMMGGALFGFVILAQWIAVMVLPCGYLVPT